MMFVFSAAVVVGRPGGWPVVGTLFATVVSATVLMRCTARALWAALVCVVTCMASYTCGTMWGAAVWVLSVSTYFLAVPYLVAAPFWPIQDGDLLGSSGDLFLVTDDMPLTRIKFWGELSDDWRPLQHMFAMSADEILSTYHPCWIDHLFPPLTVMRRSGHHSALEMLRIAKGCGTLCETSCACDCKIAVRLLEDYLERVGRRAARIQTAWRRAVSDPSYALCRKRLLSEHGEMAIEL